MDILSFGGTKNGLFLAEAVIILNPNYAKDFVFIRKQAMQLAGKMRFIAAQFFALLKDETWRKYARHECEMARLLEKEIRQHCPQIKITQSVQANSVFPMLPKQVVKSLKEKHFFYIWDEKTWVARWMCSFDTTPEDIRALVLDFKALLT